MENVLVTGGAGYIGIHLVKLLQDSGYNPIVYDLSPSLGDSHVTGNVLNETLLSETILTHNISIVCHLAAIKEIGKGKHPARRYYENNTRGTLSVIKSMLKCGINRLVFCSSAAVYGSYLSGVDEEACKNPESDYGYSKLIAEEQIEAFTRWSDLRCTVLRPFNVGGAHISGKIGETIESSAIIPSIIRVGFGMDTKFIMHGADWPTFDGTCIRDYVHVCDVADAHLRAIEHTKKSKFSVFNIGSGYGTSIMTLLEKIGGIIDKPIRVGVRKKDVSPFSLAVVDKAKSELNWLPSMSDIDKIVLTAFGWHKGVKGCLT